ncbi:MAG: class I SAM-dependent DNA methyltransferase [Armatimonadota bacterium]
MSVTQSGNPLVRQPWLYEYIYPETSIEAAFACQKIFDKWENGKTGLNILEIGCGIGRVITSLGNLGHSCTGIDASQQMVDYARIQNPELKLIKADMRSFDIGEKFDVVICVGSTFTYNLSNADLHSTLSNFRKHCYDGGLLILGMLNASRFLASEAFNERVEIRVDEGDFHANAISRHLLDRRNQSFRRIRTWKIEGYNDLVVDDAEFRLFFPLELEDYLTDHNFSVIGMWDNKDIKDSDLSGRRLYIAARAV